MYTYGLHCIIIIKEIILLHEGFFDMDKLGKCYYLKAVADNTHNDIHQVFNVRQFNVYY